MWECEIILNGKKTNSRGTTIFIGSKFEYSLKEVEKDDDGNLIVLNIKIQDMEFKIINLYGPNQDSSEFFDTVNEFITHNEQDYLIVYGDFN